MTACIIINKKGANFKCCGWHGGWIDKVMLCSGKTLALVDTLYIPYLNKFVYKLLDLVQSLIYMADSEDGKLFHHRRGGWRGLMLGHSPMTSGEDKGSSALIFLSQNVLRLDVKKVTQKSPLNLNDP